MGCLWFLLDAAVGASAVIFCSPDATKWNPGFRRRAGQSVSCAYARFFGAGGARQARYLSCLAKKGTPKKATRRSRPPPAAAGSLCFSPETAAAELASALRSAAQTVLADTPVSACDARRSRRELVRAYATTSARQAKKKQRAEGHSRIPLRCIRATKKAPALKAALVLLHSLACKPIPARLPAQ